MWSLRAAIHAGITGPSREDPQAGTGFRPATMRFPVLLGRDDDGTDYYVDRHPDQSRPYDLHLYVGRRGRVKRLKLRDVINDSGGIVLIGKGVKLKLVESPRMLTWLRPGKPAMELTMIPWARNIALIYDDLAIYRGVKQGTPCDMF